jgi:hypothetical protein
MPGEATHFLNVDLELVTRGDVDALLAHWGSLVMLRDSVEDGARTIWIELEADYRAVEPTLDAFLSLVESLPDSLQRMWDDCDVRCFNIGIQSGTSPHAEVFSIASSILRRIAAVDADVVFTVYGALSDQSG